MDEDVPLDQLLADPVARVKKNGATQNSITPPSIALYGAHRKNSQGLDLGNLAMIESLKHQLNAFTDTEWRSEPMLAVPFKDTGAREVVEPARLAKPVGKAKDASKDDLAAAIAAAQKAFPAWAETKPAERAQILNEAA